MLAASVAMPTACHSKHVCTTTLLCAAKQPSSCSIKLHSLDSVNSGQQTFMPSPCMYFLAVPSLPFTHLVFGHCRLLVVLMQKQPSRAQKRRTQQAEKEAEREAELAAERGGQGESEKAAEARQLRDMLAPLGLAVREIQVGFCSGKLQLKCSMSQLFALRDHADSTQCSHSTRHCPGQLAIWS